MEGCFNFFPSIADREFVEVRDSSRSVSLKSTSPRIIEGRAEIVKGISNNQGQVQESIFMFWEVMYKALVSCLTITLNCSRFSFYERQDGGIHISDMLIGPLNLESGISKNWAHSKEVIISLAMPSRCPSPRNMIQACI
jgi:hypothetical protein